MNMIGSIGVRTVRKRESPTTPMIVMLTIPTPGSNSSLRMTLPIASCGDLKPSLRIAYSFMTTFTPRCA